MRTSEFVSKYTALTKAGKTAAEIMEEMEVGVQEFTTHFSQLPPLTPAPKGDTMRKTFADVPVVRLGKNARLAEFVVGNDLYLKLTGNRGMSTKGAVTHFDPSTPVKVQHEA